MEIKTIHIDDNPEVLVDVSKLVNGHQVGLHEIVIQDSVNFQDGIELLKQKEYDLIILDLCVGNPSEASEKKGEEIFTQVRGLIFSPIVFFTGLPQYVLSLKSDIVKVVGKGGGYDELFKEIDIVLSSNYIEIKFKINELIRGSTRSFFWDFVHPNKNIIDKINDQTSLTYVLLRRLSKTLLNEQVKEFIHNGSLIKSLAHPIDYYIYPPIHAEYGMGDILKNRNNGEIYVILTPSCDFVDRGTKGRKVEFVLLIQAVPFKNNPDFIKYKELSESKNNPQELSKLKYKIMRWMKNNEQDKDRYFFLPETSFIEASIIDFQKKLTVKYDKLHSEFDLLTMLDDPFAQSLLSFFTRYYNRIGFPDLDTEYMLKKLFP